MANILNIETSGKTASICLSAGDQIPGFRKNINRQDHAAWLHGAIDEMMNEAGWSFDKLDAIAVSMGPGSYTGLRLGMATAKGLCYALNKPLLCVPTLEIMAWAARAEQKADYYCPMIDARRMEVFAAVYDNNLAELSPPQAIILEAGSLNHWLQKGTVLLSGDGSTKATTLVSHHHLLVSTVETDASAMPPLALKQLHNKLVADLAYSEPFYLKEFYSPAG